jgi:hypothetical protein
MKYKALQIAPEHQDSGWDWFTDDDGRLWSVVAWERGKYYLDSATPLFKRAFEIVENYDRGYYESHMNEWLNDVIEAIYNGEGKNACALCGLEQPKWQDARQAAKRAIRDYCNESDKRHRVDIVEIATEIMSAVTGIKFHIRGIRGCCQGDYAQLIIPEAEAAENHIEEIEARYFNIGEEWKIEGDDGDEFYITAYTYGYKDENKLKQIREQCDIADDDEIELWEFDGWEKTPKYKLAN